MNFYKLTTYCISLLGCFSSLNYSNAMISSSISETQDQNQIGRRTKLITRTDHRKNLRRRMPVKDFHRPIINHVLNSTNFIIWNQVEVRSFRKKLSKNFVAIFYRTIFPTMIRVAEKTLAIQQLIYQWVVCIFCSIIICHCFYFWIFKGFHCCYHHFSCAFVFHFCDEIFSRFPFYKHS